MICMKLLSATRVRVRSSRQQQQQQHQPTNNNNNNNKLPLISTNGVRHGKPATIHQLDLGCMVEIGSGTVKGMLVAPASRMLCPRIAPASRMLCPRIPVHPFSRDN